MSLWTCIASNSTVASDRVGSSVAGGGGALPALLCRNNGEAERERTRWDTEDGELCPSRTKP